jgi:glycosyltransferase involved in cell wall biosynthesis
MKNESQSKIKILFLINSLTFGGAERQTIDLVNNLDSSTFDLSLLYLNKNESLLPKIRTDSGVTVRCLDRKKKIDIPVFKEIRKYIYDNDIDIVFCVGQYPFLHAFLIKLISSRKYKLVTCLHKTIPLPGLWLSIQDNIYKRILNLNDKIIFVSKNQMEYWISHSGINRNITTYIYNSVDHNHYSPVTDISVLTDLRKDLGFDKDNFIVGINAVLRPEKMHSDFVDVIDYCRRENKKIKGLIIGDGPEREHIFDYIQKKGLGEYIQMVGYKDDVRPYVGISDCMVLTSHYVETFSISTLEAMSMGKPVVITDIGGANELISDGINGYLYQAGNKKELVGYLLSMASDDKVIHSMQKKGREIVCRNFTLPAMVKKYTSVFIELIDG